MAENQDDKESKLKRYEELRCVGMSEKQASEWVGENVETMNRWLKEMEPARQIEKILNELQNTCDTTSQILRTEVGQPVPTELNKSSTNQQVSRTSTAMELAVSKIALQQQTSNKAKKPTHQKKNATTQNKNNAADLIKPFVTTTKTSTGSSKRSELRDEVSKSLKFPIPLVNNNNALCTSGRQTIGRSTNVIQNQNSCAVKSSVLSSTNAVNQQKIIESDTRKCLTNQDPPAANKHAQTNSTNALLRVNPEYQTNFRTPLPENNRSNPKLNKDAAQQNAFNSNALSTPNVRLSYVSTNELYPLMPNNSNNMNQGILPLSSFINTGQPNPGDLEANYVTPQNMHTLNNHAFQQITPPNELNNYEINRRNAGPFNPQQCQAIPNQRIPTTYSTDLPNANVSNMPNRQVYQSLTQQNTFTSCTTAIDYTNSIKMNPPILRNQQCQSMTRQGVFKTYHPASSNVGFRATLNRQEYQSVNQKCSLPNHNQLIHQGYEPMENQDGQMVPPNNLFRTTQNISLSCPIIPSNSNRNTQINPQGTGVASMHVNINPAFSMDYQPVPHQHISNLVSTPQAPTHGQNQTTVPCGTTPFTNTNSNPISRIEQYRHLPSQNAELRHSPTSSNGQPYATCVPMEQQNRLTDPTALNTSNTIAALNTQKRQSPTHESSFIGQPQAPTTVSNKSTQSQTNLTPPVAAVDGNQLEDICMDVDYLEILSDSAEQNQSPDSPKRQKIGVSSPSKKNITKIKSKKPAKINIKMTKEVLLKSCVELVTLNGQSFDIFHSSGFKGILQPLARQINANFQINESLVKDEVPNYATATSTKIRDIIKSRLINIVIGLRGEYLGVSVQYIANGNIHTFLLGLKRLCETDFHSTNKVITSILKDYGVTHKQIHSVTKGYSSNTSEPKHVDMSKIYFPCQEIKCFSNIMKEVYEDTIKDLAFEPFINECKSVARMFSHVLRDKVPTLQKEFDKYEWDYVSTLQILTILVENKVDLKEQLSDSKWDRLQLITETLCHFIEMSSKVKTKDFTLSEVYGMWVDTKLKLSNNVVGNALMDNMTLLEPCLMMKENLLGAVYLDPRFQALLSPGEKLKAIEYLTKIWNSINEHQNSDKETVANAAICNEYIEIDLTDDDITDDNNMRIKGVLKEFDGVSDLKNNDCIIEFWKNNKPKHPELFQMAQLVFGVPVTLNNVERVFRDFDHIREINKTPLNEDLLEKVLIIRNNVGVSEAIF